MKTFSHLARTALCLLLSLRLILDPMIAAAADVTPSASAPASNRATQTVAPNGVPVINIVAPNSKGLSHNIFSDFNVGPSGLIFNNSQTTGVSQLGGAIFGNPNLNGKSASLILTEVNGSRSSLLQGAMEVFGPSADLILANPNGITCQGCGFVNTPRATLSTGTPIIDSSGAFRGLNVQGGSVSIDGGTLDVTGLDFFDIVSRSAHLNAAIKAKQLGIFTGASQYDYASRTASGGNATGSGVSLDSSLLGGMYANRITLVGTDKGVGVNLQGEVNAANALTISADGQISATVLSSGGDAALTSASSGVALNGTAYASGNLALNGASATLSGTAGAGGNVTVQAKTVNNSGILAAGLGTDGTVSDSAGKLNVQTDQLDNSGTIVSGQAGQISAGSLNNQSAGTIASLGQLTVAAGNLVNQGIVTAGGDLAASAQGALNNGGTIVANGKVTASAASVENSGTLKAGSDLALTSSGQISNSGAIAAMGNAALQGGDTGNSGVIAANGATTGQFTAFDNSGTVSTGTTLGLTSASTLANEGTIVSGGDTNLQSGALTNGGLIASGGQLTAASGSLDNKAAGTVSAGGDLHLKTSGATTNSGQIAAVGAATLQGDAGGNSGTIASNSTLSADYTSLDNSGTLSAGTALTLSIANALANGGSMVSGGGMTATLGSLTNNGAIQVNDGLALTISGSLTNSGKLTALGVADLQAAGVNNSGTIANGGTLTATFASLDNSGTLSSTSDLGLTVSGDAANSGTLVSGGALTATVGKFTNTAQGIVSGASGLGLQMSGDLSNDGLLESGGALSLVAGDPTNNGTIASSGVLSLTMEDLTNLGTLSGGTGLSLTIAKTLTNAGDITSGGDLLLQSTDLDNGGLVIAKGAMVVQAAKTATNTGALIASGDMTITGSDGNAAESITNAGGSLQTINGNMLLIADQVSNQMLGGTSTQTSSIVYNQTWVNNHSVPLGPCGMGEACGYFGHWTWVPNPTGSDAGAWYGSSSTDLPVRSYIVETGTTMSGGQAASISSGGSLRIASTTGISNLYSSISSAGDMVLTGATLNNVGTQTIARWYVSASNATMTRCYGGVCSWFDNGGGTALLKSWVADQQGGIITAGGSLTGSFTSSINNVTVSQYSPSSGNTTTVADPGVTSVVTSQVETAPPGGYTGQVNVVTGQASLVASQLQNTSFPSTLSALTTTLSQQLPGFSAQFQAAPASSSVLYETRFKYTDLGTFYGSSYFLNQVGQQTATLPKSLGDAYMDTQLISDAVLRQTGKKYLSSSYTSDSDQMQALIANAAAEASTENLVVGQALTATQIASLDKDIVWYVTEQVDGQPVLVPTLYLASSSAKSIAADGATLSAGKDVSLTGGDVTNQGGKIASGGDLAVTAQAGSLVNSGQIAAAGSAALVSVGGDVVSATSTVKVTGVTGNDRTLRVGQSGVSAGGNLTVSATAANDAGGNVSVVGSSLASGGTLGIDASGNVTVSTNQLTQNQSYQGSHYGYVSQNITHDSSSLTAGQALTIKAGGDLTVAGSSLTSGGDATLTAGGTATLTAVQNSSSESSWTKKGGFSPSKSSSDTNSVVNQGTSITSGGTVSVTSGKDLTVRASSISAGGDIALTSTGGAIGLLAGQNSESVSRTSSRSGSMWQSSTQEGHVSTTTVMDSLTAKGTISAKAANGVTIQYSVPANTAMSMQAALNQLAADPKTAWVQTLATNDPVAWQAIQNQYVSWHQHQAGLGGGAVALIAIAMAVVTAGAGTSLATGLGFAEGSMGSAAISAGLSTVATNLTVNTINGGGNLVAALGQTFSGDGLISLGSSMVTAGALAGMGNVATGTDFMSRVENAAAQSAVKSGIGTVASIAEGQSVGQALKNGAISFVTASAGQVAANEIGLAYANGTLDPVSHIVAHALLGCAVGAASGSCESGAVGAAMGEAVAGILGSALSDGKPLDQTTQQEILAAGQIAGVLGASAFNGNAQAASNAAYNAVLNNYLTTYQQAERDAEIKKCGSDQNCVQEKNTFFQIMDDASNNAYIVDKALCAMGSCDALNALTALIPANDQDTLQAKILELQPNLSHDEVVALAAEYTQQFQSSYDTIISRPLTQLLVTALLGGMGGMAAIEEVTAAQTLAAEEIAAAKATGAISQADLDALAANGIKFTPQNVVATGEAANGQIVFLETGNSNAGLQHIIEAHASDFANIGVSQDQIPSVIMRP